MGELVVEGPGKVFGVGAEEDRSGIGYRDGRAPARGSPAGERVQDVLVRYDDESERFRITAAEPRPIRRTVGQARQFGGQAKLRRPRHGGHPADLNGGRGALEKDRER